MNPQLSMLDKDATRRGSGADGRGGPRQSQQRAVSATTGRAAGAHLTGQCQDGRSRIPASGSVPGSLTAAQDPLQAAEAAYEQALAHALRARTVEEADARFDIADQRASELRVLARTAT